VTEELTWPIGVVGATEIASRVSVEETVIGLEYSAEFIVGVDPSVV
jgi:hypothetical protein